MACKYAGYMADAIIGMAVIYDIWRDDLSVPIRAIRGLNRESRITSDLKDPALRFCCDLNRASKHKSRDFNREMTRF